jgi:hypothetical protein
MGSDQKQGFLFPKMATAVELSLTTFYFDLFQFIVMGDNFRPKTLVSVTRDAQRYRI